MQPDIKPKKDTNSKHSTQKPSFPYRSLVSLEENIEMYQPLGQNMLLLKTLSKTDNIFEGRHLLLHLLLLGDEFHGACRLVS